LPFWQIGALALGLAFANGSINISKPSRATASILHLEILENWTLLEAPAVPFFMGDIIFHVSRD
jgi:hypothetical protein